MFYSIILKLSDIYTVSLFVVVVVISSSCLRAAYSGDLLLSTGDSSPVTGSQLNSS